VQCAIFGCLLEAQADGGSRKMVGESNEGRFTVLPGCFSSKDCRSIDVTLDASLTC